MTDCCQKYRLKNTKSPGTVGCRGDGIGWGELQRLVGALLDDVYNAVYVDGNGLLEEVANLAGEFVGSAHAFIQGDVFFYRKIARKLFFIRRNKCIFATDYRPNFC